MSPKIKRGPYVPEQRSIPRMPPTSGSNAVKPRLLSMDELQNRPCEVDGRPALFHRWIEKDRALLKVDAFIPYREQQRINADFLTDGFVPSCCSADVLR
jgi:hypothetical protein